MATIVNTGRDRRAEGIGQGIADFLKTRREERKKAAQREAVQRWLGQLQQAEDSEQVQKVPSLLSQLPPEAVEDTTDMVTFAQLDQAFRERASGQFNFDETQWVGPGGEVVTTPKGAEPPGPGFSRSEDVQTRESLETSDLTQEQTRAQTGLTGARTGQIQEETSLAREERATFGPGGSTPVKQEVQADFRAAGVKKPSQSDFSWAAAVKKQINDVGGKVSMFGGSDVSDAQKTAIQARMDEIYREELQKPFRQRKSAFQIKKEATEGVVAAEEGPPGGGIEDDEGGQGDGDEKRSGVDAAVSVISRQISDLFSGREPTIRTEYTPKGAHATPSAKVAPTETSGEESVTLSPSAHQQLKDKLNSGDVTASSAVKTLVKAGMSRDQAVKTVEGAIRELRQEQRR